VPEPAPGRVELVAVDLDDRVAAHGVPEVVEVVDRHVQQENVLHLLTDPAEVRRLGEADVDQAWCTDHLDGGTGRLGVRFVPAVLADREGHVGEPARHVVTARLGVRRRGEVVAEPDEEAEALGHSSDWRGGVTRFRQLLDDWKAQPRLDRHADDELWHRFSTARTTYTRRRKSHFSELSAKREGAREIKERLATKAEALATSTDWGATSSELRTLMDEWRTAGGAQKDVDDELWARFRAASDAFFAGRTEHFAVQDSEFAGNLAAKELLLAEAEKLLPVREPGPAKAALRSINERWTLIGKVPRDAMKTVEARLHAIERAVEDAEQQRWARTDPELRARAESTVAMLRDSVAKLTADLAKATAKGDARAATTAEEALVARQSWLTEAERALADFSS